MGKHNKSSRDKAWRNAIYANRYRHRTCRVCGNRSSKQGPCKVCGSQNWRNGVKKGRSE